MDGSAINPNEINRYEVTEVYAHPEAEADIVLVHVTFSSKDPTKSAKVRILVYGYNADVVALERKSASHDRIHEHAQSLVSSLALERKSEETEENPIIWVAHSLGGILVKRALEISHDYQGKSNDEIRSIAVSTFGIIFLGTPHTGADPAKWANFSSRSPQQAQDLSNSVQTVTSIEPDNTDDSAEYFIKPPGFRPNSIFCGRREELVEMHKMLFDKRRRSQGSSAVLIQSMPGGGKTHLARQYAFEHKHEFPGGVFWIRAKSEEEITAGFWQIARKAALKPSMVNEDPKVLDNPDQFVKLVKKWLNHRSHWLLILDGLDALDVPIRASEPITDRNEHETPLNLSQSSGGSIDLLSDNIDVIRLHSVVQGFFVETLHAKGKLPMWLDRAIGVFCHSFDQANDRITQKTRTGLVEDYRLYEIHGIKLQQHLKRYKKEYIKRHKKEMLDPEATHIMLEDALNAIRSEIQRRTPESSHVIAGGRSEAFQTSIFDRTSSSSDTGIDPETPADKFSLKVLLGSSGNTLNPLNALFIIRIFSNKVENIKKIQFQPQVQPKLPKEDTGYDSDREGSTLTSQPLKSMTPQADSPESPGGPWEVVKPRHTRATAQNLIFTELFELKNQKIYRTRARSFRSATSGLIDPRVTSVTAHGELQQPDNRPQSRGKAIRSIWCQSGSCANISKTSPPPIRAGGPIQDRGAAGNKLTEINLITQAPTYASAVASSTRDTASRHGTEDNFSDTNFKSWIS
ncbi:hypothetical protein DID88_000615 [Monilinia fructigena]|uniref:DUF676 domain-containing protein n=1 Tax=Monilinia fructigena TaxID=38457 RepID=A0A395INN1_9HELO|nr:hypothetical protein DID88_000615 [Monilinia fructigena]